MLILFVKLSYEQWLDTEADVKTSAFSHHPHLPSVIYHNHITQNHCMRSESKAELPGALQQTFITAHLHAHLHLREQATKTRTSETCEVSSCHS